MFLSSVCESFMLGTIATFYTTDAVLMAVGTTAAVTLALTLFAFQTKIDFTGCGGLDLRIQFPLCLSTLNENNL